ncbi:MAG TPA: tetratricopeptide repeat protein [Methylovirgula sp.]|jgi:tetratricopeptide (TPR) repeat protein
MRTRLCLSFAALGLAAWMALPLARAFADPALSPYSNDSGDDNDAPDGLPGSTLQLPGMPPFEGRGTDAQIPSLGDDPNPHRADALKPSLSPQEKAKAAKAEALKKAMGPQKSHAELRAQTLDALFKQLSKAADPDEAETIAGAIERVWLQTDSPTASVLMDRGTSAMEGQHYPLALQVFNRLLDLEPKWSEVWNKRATTRLLGGDVDGAISDMRQAVKIEPRDFTTLAALGMALHQQGLDKEALATLRRSLALDPQQPQIKDLVDKLSVEVEGRDI